MPSPKPLPSLDDISGAFRLSKARARQLLEVLQRLRAARQRRRWTAADDAVLRARYPHEPTETVARDLGRSPASTSGRALGKLGLSKSPEYLASPAACRLRPGSAAGSATRFQKGHVPANKGLRRPGYFAGRMRETQFRKGMRSGRAALHYKPLGTESYSKEGYLLRKVTETGYPPRDWRPVHHLLWIERHGPIPPSHAIRFRDGNRRNVVIENLELVHRRVVMASNTVHNLPPELRQVVQLRGALQRQINRRIRLREEQAVRPA